MGKYYEYVKKDSTRQARKKKKESKREWDSLRKAGASNEKVMAELAKRGISGDRQISYADSLQSLLKSYQSVLKDATASDSAKQAAKAKIKQMSKDKVNGVLAKSGHPYKARYREADSLKKELKKWWVVMKDTSASDSVRKLAKEKVKVIAMEQAIRNPKFQGIQEQYKLYGQKPDWNTLSNQVPGLDTLKGVFDATPEEFLVKAEGVATQALSKAGNLGELSKQAAALDQYKEQYKQLTSPEAMEEKGKEQAKEKALEQFMVKGGKLQAAQQKMTGLLGKYKSFTDSNDLSTAVKRTSLEGKSFKERMVLGGNFNVVSTDPVSIDMAPLAGYKFNTKFYMGIGMNYRHTFSDSLKFILPVSPTNASLRLFANYDLIKNFFVYSEYERAGLKKGKEAAGKQWKNNYFIGAGKKMLIHPKVFMTLTALYNLNNDRTNPTYPRRFQLRIGFQTSDLAFRKKKIQYKH